MLVAVRSATGRTTRDRQADTCGSSAVRTIPHWYTSRCRILPSHSLRLCSPACSTSEPLALALILQLVALPSFSKRPATLRPAQVARLAHVYWSCQRADRHYCLNVQAGCTSAPRTPPIPVNRAAAESNASTTVANSQAAEQCMLSAALPQVQS